MKNLLLSLGLTGMLMLTNCENVIGPKEHENYPPVAYFIQGADIIPVGFSVRFDASRSYDRDGRIIKYDWNFGDNTINSGKNITHMFRSAGEFHPVLTVTDNKGDTTSCYNPLRKPIKVLPR